jgi:hypothetical protein
MIEISETQLLDLIQCNQCSDPLYENAMVTMMSYFFLFYY